VALGENKGGEVVGLGRRGEKGRAVGAEEAGNEEIITGPAGLGRID